MGAGASAPKPENPEDDENEKEEVEEKHKEPSDTRSRSWRRAWRGLLDYEWAEDDDEYEVRVGPNPSLCSYPPSQHALEWSIAASFGLEQSAKHDGHVVAGCFRGLQRCFCGSASSHLFPRLGMFFQEHPEDEACEAVAKALDYNSLEARSSQGFLAGRCLIHLAAAQGAIKSCTLLLEKGCQVGIHCGAALCDLLLTRGF